MRTEAGNLIRKLNKMDVLPFTLNEAYQFLNFHNVDQEGHAKIVFVAGTVPWMLGYFKHTTSAFKFGFNLNLAMRPIQDMISELKQDICGRYMSSIGKSILLLSKASINSTISSGEVVDYCTSYLTNEHLTFLVKKEKKEDFILQFPETQTSGESEDMGGWGGAMQEVRK